MNTDPIAGDMPVGSGGQTMKMSENLLLADAAVRKFRQRGGEILAPSARECEPGSALDATQVDGDLRGEACRVLDARVQRHPAV